MAALTAAGVRLAGGVFSREAFRRALTLPTSTHDGKPTNDALAILGKGLKPFGIDVGDVVRGKSTLARLSAEPARFITSFDETPSKALQVGTGDGAVWARVYATATRRDGVAQFAASGFLKATAPPIYAFVLVDEAMFWLARREDFVVIDTDLRGRGAEQQGRRLYGYPGFSPHGAKPGALRLWFPRADPEHLASFHPAMRIANASLELFGIREKLRQTVKGEP